MTMIHDFGIKIKSYFYIKNIFKIKIVINFLLKYILKLLFYI